MFEERQAFLDRREAGRRLAEELVGRDWRDPVVLALPRGGVPVGFEVAKALQAPLDILLVRKIGAPGHPEFGIGAVVDGKDPQVVINEDAALILGPSSDYLEAEKKRQLEEIERRRKQYVGGRAAEPTEGRTAIVVDDGIATGSTVKVALKALRRSGAERVVVAVPVAPQSAVEALREEADEVVCLSTPEPFRAVSLHYVDFEQTTDEEVIQLLKAAAPVPAGWWSA
jgi:putative phosphoribosyl transferase